MISEIYKDGEDVITIEGGKKIRHSVGKFNILFNKDGSISQNPDKSLSLETVKEIDKTEQEYEEILAHMRELDRLEAESNEPVKKSKSKSKNLLS